MPCYFLFLFSFPSSSLPFLLLLLPFHDSPELSLPSALFRLASSLPVLLRDGPLPLRFFFSHADLFSCGRVQLGCLAGRHSSSPRSFPSSRSLALSRSHTLSPRFRTGSSRLTRWHSIFWFPVRDHSHQLRRSRFHPRPKSQWSDITHVHELSLHHLSLGRDSHTPMEWYAARHPPRHVPFYSARVQE